MHDNWYLPIIGCVQTVVDVSDQKQVVSFLSGPNTVKLGIIY